MKNTETIRIAVCVEDRTKLTALKKMISTISDKASFTYRKNLQKLRQDAFFFEYDHVVLGQSEGKNFFPPEVLIGGDESISAGELFITLQNKLGFSSKGETVEESTERLFRLVEDKMRNDIEYTDSDVRELIVETVRQDRAVNPQHKDEVCENVFNIIRRFDVLTEFLEDNEITEIMVNGTDNIFVEGRNGLVRVEKCFSSKDRLRNVINRMVCEVGRQIDEANPIVDARLKDGSRVNAVLEPIAINGPSLTIRRFPKAYSMQMLVDNGTLTGEASGFLSELVRAKYNIFVSGSTASGKTTLLNSLSEYIDKDERIVTIEDSAELQIKHIPNIIRMEVRLANSSGRGAVTIGDLIKNSLRMRPDRIIVGEVRREEAYDMLQAMNTGHDGSLSTGHANSASDMMRRLETMILTNSTIPLPAIRGTVESAIDIVVHLSRMRNRSRRVVEISEVDGFNEDGSIRLIPLYVYDDRMDALVQKNKLKDTRKLETRKMLDDSIKIQVKNRVAV